MPVKRTPKPHRLLQTLSQEEPEMSDTVDDAIRDTKADLDAAEQVLRLRVEELQFARGNMNLARDEVEKLSKLYRNLLQSKLKGEPA